MKHFTPKYDFDAAYKWLASNADAECSILVDLPFGTAVYMWVPWVNPIYTRLYGPLKEYKR